MNSIVLFALILGNAAALRLSLLVEPGYMRVGEIIEEQIQFEDDWNGEFDKKKPPPTIRKMEEGIRKCDKCNCKKLPNVNSFWQRTIDKFAEKGQDMPISAASIRGAFQRNYHENHHRLQLAAEKLLSGAGINVFVIGGSLSAGQGPKALSHKSPGCGNRWSDQLQEQLRSQLGSEEWGTINVVNAAHSGTRADWFLNHISMYEEALNKTDIFINEYHFNDGGGRADTSLASDSYKQSVYTMNEKIYKLVSSLPKKPAFLFFDLPDWSDDSLTMTAQESLHYTVAKKHEIPLLWHVDAVKASGHAQMDHQAKLHAHPECFPCHEILASEMSGVIHQEMKDVCAWGVRGKDIVEIGKSISCEFHPSFSVSANTGLNTFKPVDNVGWEFGEDVKGKPGWIAKKGPPGEISFSVPMAKGEIKVEYLRSYENIGTTICQLENSSGNKLGTLELPGLWDLQSSLSVYAEMSLQVEPGDHMLRCKSDGKKSKIMSIMAC